MAKGKSGTADVTDPGVRDEEDQDTEATQADKKDKKHEEPVTRDDALLHPHERAAERVEGSTSDAMTREEGIPLSEVGRDTTDGPHSTDDPDYGFPQAGDVEVATVEPGSGEGEWFAGVRADDWIVLKGGDPDNENARVPAYLDGHRAVVVDAPSDPVPWDEKDQIELTVRTRDQYNATLHIKGKDIAAIHRNGEENLRRG